MGYSPPQYHLQSRSYTIDSGSLGGLLTGPNPFRAGVELVVSHTFIFWNRFSSIRCYHWIIQNADPNDQRIWAFFWLTACNILHAPPEQIDSFNPRYPSWVVVTLLVIIIWRALALLICFGIMVLPFYKGIQSRKKHAWMIRKRYPQARSESACSHLTPKPRQILKKCTRHVLQSLAHVAGSCVGMKPLNPLIESQTASWP